MKILQYHCKRATFLLDGTDIGDYIEAEFVAYTGGMIIDSPNGAFPGYETELLLLFSANDAPPESVNFRIAGPKNIAIMRGRQPGELLRMWPEHRVTRHYSWYQLCINHEIGSGCSGREKVKR
jgi:hypothetical protein